MFLLIVPFFNSGRLNSIMYIYEITINKYKYIGSTKNKRKRKSDHLRLLKLKKHVNPFVQNVYNKYGDYEFKILEYCEDLEQMKMLEEQYIKEYKLKYDKCCMNILSCYGGGSEWRNYKTVEELKIYDYNRTRLPPEKRAQRNLKHSKTIQNIPRHERQHWYDNGAKKRSENIKERKNYTPINIQIFYPDGTTKFENYDTEALFFKGTNLEETSLRELKNRGEKVIKRRLKLTKHIFPIGTVLKLI